MRVNISRCLLQWSENSFIQQEAIRQIPSLTNFAPEPKDCGNCYPSVTVFMLSFWVSHALKGSAYIHRQKRLLGSSQELYKMNYSSPFSANGIQFINKDDGRSFFLCESKSIAYQLRSITDEHLHKLWTRQLQERGLGSERELILALISQEGHFWVL